MKLNGNYECEIHEEMVQEWKNGIELINIKTEKICDAVEEDMMHLINRLVYRQESKSLKRRRDSYEDPGSVASSSNYTDADSPAPAKRKRGRPPKSSSGPSSPSQFDNLDGEDLRYHILREKNNEASRKSRLNKKEKEDQFERELDDLLAENRELVAKCDLIETEKKKWHSKLLRLALIY